MSRYLEERIAGLSEEIRRYPTPIACCDEQLAGLIEERARLLSQLDKQSCSPAALWTNDGGFNGA
jgi:uncharacterized small protein (DUF1192 family)